MITAPKGWLALMVALTVAVAPLAIRQAHAGPQDDARLYYQNGKRLFDNGDYRSAIAEFAKANSLAPSAVLEFNIGLCHDRLGEKPEAVRRYRSYLRQSPGAANAAAVREKIDRIERELADESQRAAEEARAAEDARKAEDARAAEEARKAEEARAAEEANKIEAEPAPIDPGREPAGPAPGPVEPRDVAPAPSGEQTYAPTGDPGLDRAAAIDIQSIQRNYEMDAPSQPPPTGPPDDARGAMSAGAAPAPPQQAGPATDSGRKQSKPVYKQWWFWVVVGVSALILIDIARDDNTSSATRGLGLDAQPDAAGPVLLRF